MKGKWKKSPPELIASFDTAIAGKPGVERRLMFGYPAAFVNGHLVSGLFEDQMMVRLSETHHVKAIVEAGAKPFAPGGRPMREYVVLPPRIVADKRQIGLWLGRAIAYVNTLPVKPPKAKRGS